jgi:hypothetical protein
MCVAGDGSPFSAEISRGELGVDPGNFFRRNAMVEQSAHRSDSRGSCSYHGPGVLSHFHVLSGNVGSVTVDAFY